MERELILADLSILPDVYRRVLEAKKLLESGEARTVHEAAEQAQISRSAYYKYKDSVFPFNQMHGVLTLLAVVLDVKGVLRDMLDILSEAACNILTINQGVPLNGVANITITIQTDAAHFGLDTVIAQLKRAHGVRSVTILAKQ